MFVSELGHDLTLDASIGPDEHQAVCDSLALECLGDGDPRKQMSPGPSSRENDRPWLLRHTLRGGFQDRSFAEGPAWPVSGGVTSGAPSSLAGGRIQISP